MLDDRHHSSDQTPMTPCCLCTCRSIWPSVKFSRLQGRCVRPQTSSRITTVVYMHLTDLFVIYLHAIYLFETAGRTCTSFLVQRTETQSSIVTTDMIRAAAAGGYLHHICEAWCDRYGERGILKQPNHHHVFKWEKKTDRVNIRSSSFVTQWCVPHTAWDVSRDRKWP